MNIEFGTEAAQFPEKKIHKWNFRCRAHPPYMLNVVNMYITLLGSYSRIPTVNILTYKKL